MSKPPVPMLSRLWPKVRKADGCWEWLATRTSNGYGQFWAGRYSATGQPLLDSAHRVVYEALVGPIPAGLELDHLCRNAGCVNPAHLEPVTHAENVRRRELANPRQRSARGRFAPAPTRS